MIARTATGSLLGAALWATLAAGAAHADPIAVGVGTYTAAVIDSLQSNVASVAASVARVVDAEPIECEAASPIGGGIQKLGWVDGGRDLALTAIECVDPAGVAQDNITGSLELQFWDAEGWSTIPESVTDISGRMIRGRGYAVGVVEQPYDPDGPEVSRPRQACVQIFEPVSAPERCTLLPRGDSELAPPVFDPSWTDPEIYEAYCEEWTARPAATAPVCVALYDWAYPFSPASDDPPPDGDDGGGGGPG